MSGGLLGSVRGSKRSGGGPVIRIPTPNSSRMKKLPTYLPEVSRDEDPEFGEEEDRVDLAAENEHLKQELEKIKEEHSREIGELYAEQNQVLEDFVELVKI